jgi:hypothetical protein
MVCFPLIALSGLLVGGVMLAFFSSYSLEWVLAISSIVSLVLGLVSMPYCMAVWMWFDHSFHPLEAADRQRYLQKIGGI